ncbi:MAG: 16S rRNA (guanine(527)-N(7))-methyltransferase RsmG [Chloroflexota bacterium]
MAEFGEFQRALLDWNQRANLTSITEPADVQVKHFLDSLTVLTGLPEAVRLGMGPAALLDVGAGAGFPGLPLAIVRPLLDVTLLEATQKKCRFLEHIVAVLGLPNVDVLGGRAEELAREPARREAYDVVVARAVASLAALAELCLPFVKIGGRMIAPKKVGIESEVAAAGRAIGLLGGRLAVPIIVRVPFLDEARQLIVVEKVRPTPTRYPRRPGLPAKLPL